jgi:hypothetical protein
MKASRTINRLHHSPTTSRHWATEQFMSSKLVRCTNPRITGCVIERTRWPTFTVTAGGYLFPDVSVPPNGGPNAGDYCGEGRRT